MEESKALQQSEKWIKPEASTGLQVRNGQQYVTWSCPSNSLIFIPFMDWPLGGELIKLSIDLA